VSSAGLYLNCASVSIPQSGKKRNPKGEDAHFYNSTAAGVFDGVGGWAQEGVNPRAYAQAMNQAVSESTRQDSIPPLKEMLWDAYTANDQQGSCTASVVVLRSMLLDVACLGDSQAMLLRDGFIVMRSEPQQHKYNQPFQMSHTGADTPDDAQVWDYIVQEGDIVILGTDGLFDNLAEKHIVAAARQFDIRFQACIMQGDDKRPSRSAVDTLYQFVERLAGLAFQASVDQQAETPFSEGLNNLNPNSSKSYRGGKPDDITVLVARVSEEKVRLTRKSSIDFHTSFLTP